MGQLQDAQEQLQEIQGRLLASKQQLKEAQGQARQALREVEALQEQQQELQLLVEHSRSVVTCLGLSCPLRG